MRRIRFCVSMSLCVLLLASPAGARTTMHDLTVKTARDSEIGRAKLLDVPFYMAGEKHGAIAKDYGTITSNRRTNAFGKSDEEACQIAFLSAVIALQSRAEQLGGNAVVDVKSLTKNQDLASASKYRCAAGGVVANVALSGRVVRIK